MSQLTRIEDGINRSLADTISVGTGGISFQNAGEVMEYAKMMAVSGSAVPKHLRGQPGACLGIIDDAIRFQTSPYALARKSFFVNDNLAYEAQVIAGIVNRFAPLKQRPNVEYEGDGENRKCIVTFEFLDGAVRVYESPELKDINPKNSPLWKNDPDQQQSYYSLRAGARRYCPEIILGMYDIDELRAAQMRDVTPRQTAADRFAAKQAQQQEQPQAEGFDLGHVHATTAQAMHQEPEDVSQDDEPALDLAPADDAPLHQEGATQTQEQEDAGGEDVLVAFADALERCETAEEVTATNNEFAPRMNTLSDADKAAGRLKLKEAKDRVGGAGK